MTPKGQLVVELDVEVFAVLLANAPHAFAWSVPSTGPKQRLYAVLGAYSINSPADAARAVIASEYLARRP